MKNGEQRHWHARHRCTDRDCAVWIEEKADDCAITENVGLGTLNHLAARLFKVWSRYRIPYLEKSCCKVVKYAQSHILQSAWYALVEVAEPVSPNAQLAPSPQ